MTAPRLNSAAERQIPEFEVWETGTAWRAVHREDRALVIEHHDWRELFWACVSTRIAQTIRTALDAADQP